MHKERIDTYGKKVIYQDKIENLPEGTFIIINKEPYLITRKYLFQWTPFGYQRKLPLPRNKDVHVLTPRSIVNTFSAGYIPQMAVHLV